MVKSIIWFQNLLFPPFVIAVLFPHVIPKRIEIAHVIRLCNKIAKGFKRGSHVSGKHIEEERPVAKDADCRTGSSYQNRAEIMDWIMLAASYQKAFLHFRQSHHLVPLEDFWVFTSLIRLKCMASPTGGIELSPRYFFERISWDCLLLHQTCLPVEMLSAFALLCLPWALGQKFLSGLSI